MSRPIHRLTVLQATHFEKPGAYADGGGLYLRVTAVGTRSWIFVYFRNRKRREMGLGGFPTVGLKEVRDLVVELRRAVRDGRDPLAERRAARAPLSTTNTGDGHGDCSH